MRLERVKTPTYNVVIADNNHLFRRGLCGLLGAEADFKVVAEASTEAELLVALERQRADALIAPAEFLQPAGLFLSQLRVDGRQIPTVGLVAEPESALVEGAILTIPRSQATTLLLKQLRGLLRPETAALKQASDLRALVLGSGWPVNPDVLTHREKEVVRLLSDGLTVREAAVELGLSCKTVEAHTLNLMRKLDIHSRSSLIQYAIATGMADQRVVA